MLVTLLREKFKQIKILENRKQNLLNLSDTLLMRLLSGIWGAGIRGNSFFRLRPFQIEDPHAFVVLGMSEVWFRLVA